MAEIRLLRADEIEIRVSKATDKGTNWLLYKTARTDMEILDEMYGAERWQNDYKVVNGNLQCGIGIKFDNEWVWKWDCGTESNTEKEKGEASDSFKRAGFRWGIGRELYSAPKIFIPSTKVPVAQQQNRFACYAQLVVKDIDYVGRKITRLIVANDKNEVVYYYEEKNMQYFERHIADAKKVDDLNALFKDARTVFDKDSKEMNRFVELCKAKKESLTKGE